LARNNLVAIAKTNFSLALALTAQRQFDLSKSVDETRFTSSKVLDAGTGTGQVNQVLAKHYGIPGSSEFQVDLYSGAEVDEFGVQIKLNLLKGIIIQSTNGLPSRVQGYDGTGDAPFGPFLATTPFVIPPLATFAWIAPQVGWIVTPPIFLKLINPDVGLTLELDVLFFGVNFSI
jgi:hypothetical protein